MNRAMNYLDFKTKISTMSLLGPTFLWNFWIITPRSPTRILHGGFISQCPPLGLVSQ